MQKRAHSSAAKKASGKRRETVFLSGTDRVRDVMSQIYSALKRMGFRPWWFAQPDFPTFSDNAMDSCLAAARSCDRFVLVLDERAGLRYGETGTTITEAEFNEAHARNIPCLVFIRDRIWHQSRVYHRCRAKSEVDKERFETMMLDGDQEVYEFIERIQHKTRNGKPGVPWITPFDLADEIVKAIRAKWLITDKAQFQLVAALRDATEERRVPEVPVTRHGGNIIFSRRALEEVESLSEKDRQRFLVALQALERGAAFDPRNPLRLRRIATGPPERELMVLTAGGLYVKLSANDPNRITIVSVHPHAAK